MSYNNHREAEALRLRLSDNGQARVSANFLVREFRSKDDAPEMLIHFQLVDLLEAIRAVLGKPVRIDSGYRSPAHNRKVGGASASYHVKGMAADIVVPGARPSEVASVARGLGAGGVKAYNSFTHVDVGPVRTW